MRRSLQLNPDNRPATWEQVQQWRDTHEAAPIQTSLGLFHADNLSVEIRMKGSIEQFENLPTLNSDGTLTWKQPGQVYTALTKTQLQTVYSEIKINGAIRSSKLHVKAAQLRQEVPMPTPAQISDINFWLPT